MANKRCPSCGAPYNGKKCRVCLYAPMDPDGIPRASPPVNLPNRKISGKQKRQKTALGSVTGFLVILAVLAGILPGIRNWGLELETAEVSLMTPEPLPENVTALYKKGSVTILAQTTDWSANTGIPIWVYNEGPEDLTVVLKEITVNQKKVDYPRFSLEVPANTIGKAPLPLSSHDLLNTDIPEVTFVLEIRSSSGAFLWKTDILHLDSK